jgi:formate-nitrite transporter family protein
LGSLYRKLFSKGFKMTIEQNSNDLVYPVTERDHAQGPPNAPITLLEYGDYECPYCGRAYPIVKELQQRMGGRLRFVFRNFPLNSVHPHASIAAQSAEAASAQGKFWEMHDMLYEHQDDLADADLTQYALKLGLELYRFRSDLASEIFARRIEEDVRTGKASGVTGTPSLFINGKRYRGPLELPALESALQEAAGT